MARLERIQHELEAVDGWRMEQQVEQMRLRQLRRLQALATLPGFSVGVFSEAVSIAGVQATPFFASYAASKSYVHSFSAGLRRELARHGIAVTCLQPGFVKTGFDTGCVKNSKLFEELATSFWNLASGVETPAKRHRREII